MSAEFEKRADDVRGLGVLFGARALILVETAELPWADDCFLFAVYLEHTLDAMAKRYSQDERNLFEAEAWLSFLGPLISDGDRKKWDRQRFEAWEEIAAKRSVA